jgi:hypothetical protein
MTLRGHEQVMQVVRAFWDALSDAKITAVDLVATGNVVLAEGTIAGTHSCRRQRPKARTTESPAVDRPATPARYE